MMLGRLPRWLIGAALALGLAMSLLACQGSSASPDATPERSAKPPAYKVVTSKETGLGSALSYAGEVRPRTQVALSAKTMGRIQELSVDVGSEVKAGDVIATLDRIAIEAQVNQAEAGLLAAQARVTQMEAGSRSESIAQAEANLDSARQRLASTLAGPRAETVAQAEASLDSARQRLASAKAGPRAEAVAQAEAGLRVAEAKLAQLLAGPTPEQIEVAKANIRIAKDNLYYVQTTADAYRGAAVLGLPYTKEMKEAQTGVGFEQIKLAEAQLATLLAKPPAAQVAEAQAGVDAAREQLRLARNPLTDWDIAQVENAVRVAEEQLRLAQNPYTEWDIAQLQNGVRVAEEQAKLARSPFTAEDLEVARAQVAQAKGAVDVAKAQLADTVVTAPFDGVVAERLLAAGSLASPGAPIVSLISSDLEVSLSVEEARSGALKVGQPVTVQVSAYPGQGFDGRIISVAPAVDPRTRTLSAKVSLKDDQKQLKAGMYADVAIAAGQNQSGLVVPKGAVAKRGDQYVVFLVAEGKAVLREVQVGPTDGKNIQILKGLSTEDSVVQNPGSSLQAGDVIVP